MQTFAIISQKGGAGKTTLAINFAAAAEAAGKPALVIDADPQATACQWANWRDNAPPEVIDSAPPRIASKIEQAERAGAGCIVIDTPPHADNTATTAAKSADLVLIPCRPSAFDLSAIKTTVELTKQTGVRAFVVFMGGAPNAPRQYEEARELVGRYGAQICPHMIADRASFRHAAAEGRTIFEFEPKGKAAQEIAQVYKWACKHANMSAGKSKERAVI